MGLGGLRESVMDRGPGVLQFMGSQRVRHDRETELNWTKYLDSCICQETVFSIHLIKLFRPQGSPVFEEIRQREKKNNFIHRCHTKLL